MKPDVKNIKVRPSLYIATLAACICMVTCGKKIHHRLSQFIDPSTCGGCHEDIYNQWRNSMHNLSHQDPLYRAFSQHFLKGLTKRGELKEGQLCVKCHTPVGYITGYPARTSDEYIKTPKIATRGIQCDYCHSISSSKKTFNAAFEFEPGHGEENPGTKRGPFKDAESDFHKSLYSELHTTSKICGTCHNVRHVAFKTWLSSTYNEWEMSPYNATEAHKRVHCQGCHMYQLPGKPATGTTARLRNPGIAAPGGPTRDHIFTHYFCGGNHTIPGLFGDTMRRGMTNERLVNAATIKIGTDRLSRGIVTVTVTNTGAGHYLPTGVSEIRQVWIELAIKNERGVTVYSSGVLDKKGYLPDKAVIYNTVFGDGRGKPVVNLNKAREILKDKRIPPKESMTERFTIKGLDGKVFTAVCRLLYRTAPQRLVDTIMGEGAVKLPVVEMCRDRKRISF